jgi:hypothetical protein
MFRTVYIRTYIIAFILTFIAGCILFYLNILFKGSFWNGMEVGNAGLFYEYCEQNRLEHFIRQPMNTYSNLVYLFIGFIICQLGQFDSQLDNHKNPTSSFPFLSMFFGLCMLYLGIGSAYYHASLTWNAQRIDMNGTYGVCLFLIGISLYRFITQTDSNKKFKAIYVLTILTLMYLFFYLHLKIKSAYLLPILIFITVALTTLNYWKNKNNYRIQYAVLSILFLVASAILRWLDVQKIGCMPTSIYQGHAFWHLFTGMSTFFLYLFYRSENAHE